MGLTNGIFGWADLATPDPDAAAAFYRAVFGWTAVGSGTQPYTLFRMGDEVVAGMGELDDEMLEAGQPSVWSSYVIVDDLDKTIDAAVARGGTVMVPPIDGTGPGRMAFIIDAVGATVGLWESAEFDGATAFNVPGAMTWNELYCRDTDAAEAFYGDVFGWTTETVDAGGVDYLVASNAGRSNGGIMDISTTLPEAVPASWNVYFLVEDPDAATDAARDAGGSVATEPTDITVGRMATLVDPFGASFSIIRGDADGQPPR